MPGLEPLYLSRIYIQKSMAPNIKKMSCLVFTHSFQYYLMIQTETVVHVCNDDTDL